MTAAVDWTDLQLVAAFVAGAVLATIAVLRVVRSVVQIFAERPLRARRSRSKPDDES